MSKSLIFSILKKVVMCDFIYIKMKNKKEVLPILNQKILDQGKILILILI